MWEDSLKDMKARISVENRKASDAAIRAAVLQEEYWTLESQLEAAKTLDEITKKSTSVVASPPHPAAGADALHRKTDFCAD